jgi:hypothetical protein
MSTTIVTERSTATDRFPAGVGYRAACCPDPSLLPHRNPETAADDLAEHQFALHGACHPRFCPAYRRHGSAPDGSPNPCPTVCGRDLDIWGLEEGGCARPPHPADEPCSDQHDFDVEQWIRDELEEAATQKALIARFRASSP